MKISFTIARTMNPTKQVISLHLPLVAISAFLILYANSAQSMNTSVQISNSALEQSQSQESTIAQNIQSLLNSNKNIKIESVSFAPDAFREIYTAMEFQPLWVDDNGITKRAQSAIKAIANAHVQGLNPARYNLDIIETLAHTMSLRAANDANTLAQIDLLISKSILSYMEDARGGMMAPQRKERISMNRKSADSIRLLSQAATTNDFEVLINQQAPDSPEYHALLKTLKEYKTLAQNGGWENWTIGKSIRPNTKDTRIPTLRRILAVMGDYAGNDLDNTDYDAALVDAVKQFQTRHGLNPEGVIGATTQKYLAVPIESRIRQITVNLERMRWMPSDLGTKHVLVNVPGYMLYGFDGGKQTLSMRVIVGKPKTSTPIFSNVITNVVFNPSWSAPQSIVRGELLPKLRNNPEYFINAGFNVYHNGARVNPYDVNPDAGGSFAFQQRPSTRNALGKIKFNLPDNDSIYLHSTAKPELFKTEMRALSHGCVRLEDPKAMAQYVLGNEEGWDAEKIERTYDASAQRSVSTSEIPVHLVYWTAWTDASGLTYFYDDVYNKDGGIEAAITPSKSKILKLAENN